MFQVEKEGRYVRLRPLAGVQLEKDGWLVMESTTAQQLIETLSEQRRTFSAAGSVVELPDEDG